jgi:thymidylate synthase
MRRTPASLIRPPSYSSFDLAYPEVLREIAENHEFINAPRGNSSREILGASFRLTNPLHGRAARQPGL